MLVNNQPFELGETLAGTDADGNLINADKLGLVYEFPASDLSGTTPKKRRTGKPIKAIALRNLSGARLYGKRIARCNKTAGYALVQSVDGYSTVLNDGPAVIIDEFIATVGVAANDIFWGIVSGPVTVLTPLAGATFNATGIAVGDNLVAATGSTTGATSSGRIAGHALANATDAAGAFAGAANRIGHALSARTSGETNSDLLIDACIQL